MNFPRIVGTVLFVLGASGPAMGQTTFGPQSWMLDPLDRGARPEGCGTSGFSVPKPNAELFSGMGTGRGLEQIAWTHFRDPLAQAQNAEETSLYEAVTPSIVLLVTDEGLGSGFLVDQQGDVLTNWHVVRGFTDVAVVFAPARNAAAPPHNEIVRGRVIRVDEVSDLALVRLAAVPEGRNPLALANVQDISVGINVQAVGHPAAETWTHSRGVISQHRQGFAWSDAEKGRAYRADVILTQMTESPGNTGEPLMNGAGAVLGIDSFRSYSAEAPSLAVSVDEIRAFLSRPDDHRVKTSAAAAGKATTGAECEGKEVHQGRTMANDGLMVAFDMRCTGHVDLEIVMPDDQSKPTLLRADRNLDGKPDILMLDLQRRGQWDISFWDSNFDGTWSLVGHHPSGGTAPTFYESSETYRSSIVSN